jgi:hypothetical protein
MVPFQRNGLVPFLCLVGAKNLNGMVLSGVRFERQER